MTRRKIAMAAYNEGKIGLDVLGQLAIDNFSDAAICRAMCRGWITEDFAELMMTNGMKEEFVDTLMNGTQEE